LCLRYFSCLLDGEYFLSHGFWDLVVAYIARLWALARKRTPSLSEGGPK